ncbi:hypothetical protein ACORG1_33990 (plasmid) [Mycobacterium sp. TJFP1]|uniref:hypothetical protein n=1 Tax=Mycobacterium sp. MS1601 TaxID=1936029 RepID=UPI00097978B4|nr:hypothetical protein [Mycobacterium sp. MS1601]AQA06924.1 hypothetical protein BVC93_30945 [Mycobacterium sp. MS1601]
MRAVKIGADGWVAGIDLDPRGHRASHPATLVLWHNLDLWYSDQSATSEAEPNMAAMGLALAVSDHAPHDLPLICGNAIVVATDPETATPASMSTQQCHAVSYALLTSLAA